MKRMLASARNNKMKLNQFIRNAAIPSVATAVLLVGMSYGETRLSNTNVSLAFESATESFLEDTCLDCHSGASADAGLDLETLPRDGSAFEKWVMEEIKSSTKFEEGRTLIDARTLV